MDKQIKRKGLGKGLGALLSERNQESNDLLAVDDRSFEILTENISTNPYQPRTNFDSVSLIELKESIQAQGIIQPITVRKIGENKYQLISGERRLQASKMAGLSKIPAYVREASDTQMLEMGLIENIQRENLNAMEVAIAYKRLIDECNIKQEEVGAKVGKERSTVTNYLRLLNLPPAVQEGLKLKKLSMGHARALLGIEDEKTILSIYKDIVENELSVRKVEEIIKNHNSDRKPKPSTQKSIKATKFSLNDLQENLSEVFKRKVLVFADENSKGEIKIPFGSKSDLDDILNKLKKK
ncbi:MAG: ParB/RepB/Spo0J family partition protein [Cytophagaceae bacterium]|nr:ParB/RepB/Spo0J family partition protein [Cytophagaceae bacterium]